MAANVHSRAAKAQVQRGLNRRAEPQFSEAVVAGVLHDVNNLFQAALALVSMVRQKTGKRHPADAKLLRLEECTVRASALTNKLRSYLSPGDSSGAFAVDLNALAKDLWRWLEADRLEADRLDSGRARNVCFRVFTQPQPIWVRAFMPDCLSAAVECAGELLRQAQGETDRPLVLDISVDMSPRRERALLEIRLVGQCLRSRLGGALTAARDSLSASGGELETHDSSGPGRASAIDLWFPLLRGSSGDVVATSDLPSDGLIGESLADMLRDLGRVVSQISQERDPTIQTGEAVNDSESPLR